MSIDSTNTFPYRCPNHPNAQIRLGFTRVCDINTGGYPSGTGVNKDLHYYCAECGMELFPPNTAKMISK